MILIGEKNIPFEQISFIDSQEQIKSTKPNSTIIFNYNIELMKYCKENDVSYGVILTSIKEAIYSNALEAKYIIAKEELATKLQDLATNYLFDSKILAIIKNDDQIESIALKNIDGIIYEELLV